MEEKAKIPNVIWVLFAFMGIIIIVFGYFMYNQYQINNDLRTQLDIRQSQSVSQTSNQPIVEPSVVKVATPTPTPKPTNTPTPAPTRNPNLTAEDAQRALDKFARQQRGTVILKGGIQEIPAQNIAKAGCNHNGIHYTGNDGSDLIIPSDANCYITFTKYTDGNWVLTKIYLGYDSGGREWTPNIVVNEVSSVAYSANKK